MDVAVLVFLILILVVAFLRLWPSPHSTGRRSRKVVYTRNKKTLDSSQLSPYRSVSIVCDSGACEAAKALRHEMFLTSEAPLFPLPDCGCSVCSCKYAHHEDRRNQSEDRRTPMALSTELFERTGRKDRRTEGGRRSSDWGFA
jgi:hypothetical protein